MKSKKRSRLLPLSELMILMTLVSGCDSHEPEDTTDLTKDESQIWDQPHLITATPEPSPSPISPTGLNSTSSIEFHQPIQLSSVNSDNDWNHLLLYYYLFSSSNIGNNGSPVQTLPQRFDLSENIESKKVGNYSNGNFTSYYISSNHGSSFLSSSSFSSRSFSSRSGTISISRGGFGSTAHSFSVGG